MFFLRLATAGQVLEFGPFVSSSDAFTPVASTSANTEIKLNKHNSTAQVSKNSGGSTHIANGWFQATFDATDSDTVGRLKATINSQAGSSLSFPVWFDAMVMPANVFDAMFGSTQILNVNPVMIAGSTTAANAMSSAALATLGGAVGGALSVSTAILNLEVAAPTDGQIQGRQIIFDRATGTAGLREQATQVSTWTAATSTATFAPLSVSVASSDVFRIF